MHDNTKVRDFLFGYFSAGELCREYLAIDDIFSGVLALKSPGDSSTRSLSRQVLFHVLQWCQTIDVASINTVSNGQYAYRTLAGYAATARVASKAIEGFIDRVSPARADALTVSEARRRVDEPYEMSFGGWV